VQGIADGEIGSHEMQQLYVLFQPTSPTGRSKRGKQEDLLFSRDTIGRREKGGGGNKNALESTATETDHFRQSEKTECFPWLDKVDGDSWLYTVG